MAGPLAGLNDAEILEPNFMELKVMDNKGKESSTVQFDESLVKTNASKAVLHEAVVAHLANQRSVTHSALTRAEVSGGGIKPWKQKHTGRARGVHTLTPLAAWRDDFCDQTPRLSRESSQTETQTRF